MKARFFDLCLSVVTVLSLYTVWQAFTQLNPFTAPGVALFFVYCSLLLMFTGVLYLAGRLIRLKYVTKQLATVQITRSLRQGLWLAILILGYLLLQRYHADHWYVLLLFVVLLVLIEALCMGFDKERKV